MQVNWKDLVLRAVWTFVQAAGATLLVLDMDQLGTAALVAAVAAGLSAVKTYIRETL
jgi:hypothetical protein